MPSSLESLPQCFESTWRTHLIMQKAFGTCRSTAQSVTSSSHTFTAFPKAAPEGFLSCTAGSAQLSLSPGSSSALLSWWSWSTWAQGWGEATRERRDTLGKARLGLEPCPSSVTAGLAQPMAHMQAHSPEGKPGIHLTALGTWLYLLQNKGTRGG